MRHREREAQEQAGTEAANWRSTACGADRAQGAEGTRHRRHTARRGECGGRRARRAQAAELQAREAQGEWVPRAGSAWGNPAPGSVLGSRRLVGRDPRTAP